MIGEGAAGLAAARHLTSELDVFDVRVFEQGPRVGGIQPRTQACSRYPSEQRRLGTERDSARRPGRIFPTSFTGDVTSEIAEDDWERGCTFLYCLRKKLTLKLSDRTRETIERGLRKGSGHYQRDKTRWQTLVYPLVDQRDYSADFGTLDIIP